MFLARLLLGACLTIGLIVAVGGCRRPIVDQSFATPPLAATTATANGLADVGHSSAQMATASRGEQATTRTLEGHIVLLDREHSRMILDSHKETITINERSMIMLNGHQSDLMELEAGLLAMVLARQDEGKLVARAIDAHKVH